MMDAIRIGLLLLAIASTALYGWHLGHTWSRRALGGKVTGLGWLALLAYAGIGQIKASAYGLPVDAVTGLGVLALTLIAAGLTIRSIRHEGA